MATEDVGGQILAGCGLVAVSIAFYGLAVWLLWNVLLIRYGGADLHAMPYWLCALVGTALVAFVRMVSR